RRAPYARDDGTIRERNRDEDLFAGVIHGRTQRRVLRVDVDVLRNLVAVTIDSLIEVALPVQQADGDERQPEIARGLQVIAGEDTEPAGVDREALVESVLGAEIRDDVVLAELRGFVTLRSLLEIRV